MKYKVFSLLALALFYGFAFVFSTFAYSSLHENGDIVILEHDESQITVLDDSGNPSLFFGGDLQHFLEWDEPNNAFIFSDDIDFGGNEIINFRLENLAIAPVCDPVNNGAAYHNTTTKYSYVCDGSLWNILDNDENSIPVILPYVYLLEPDTLGLNVTETITITGSNFNPSTTFQFGNGVTVQNITIVNSTTAEVTVLTGNTSLAVEVTALNLNQSWAGNMLILNVTDSINIENVIDNFTDNAAGLGQWVPNLYAIRYDAGFDGDRIRDGGNDMYDNGNFIHTNLADNISYTAGTLVNDEALFGTNGRYFTSVQNNIFFLSATIGVGVTDFFITGNLGADGRGTTDTLEFNYGGYTAYIKRVYGAGSDPSVNHIFLVKEGGTLTRFAHPNTDNDSHSISGLETLLNNDGEAPFYYFLFASEQGGFIDDNTMRNIVTYMVENIFQ